MENFLPHNLDCNYRKDKDLPKSIKMSFYHEKTLKEDNVHIWILCYLNMKYK